MFLFWGDYMDLKRNRDRGTIKWTALMLPEQIQRLHEWTEEMNKIPEPAYDEFELEEIAYQIRAAVQTNSIVRVVAWKDGASQELEGTIPQLPVNTPYIAIHTARGNQRVFVPHILSIEVFSL